MFFMDNARMAKPMAPPLCTLMLAAAFLPPATAVAQQRSDSAAPLPDGWHVVPNGKLKGVDGWGRRCFNLSRNEWEVTVAGDGVEIKKRKTWKEGDLPYSPPTPARLKLQPWMPGPTVEAGLKSSIHFEGTWLLGYNRGEFGGGLWITNDDGSETKRLVNDNVHALLPFDGGILVLTGVAHLMSDFGNALIFANPKGMEMALNSSLRLDDEPRTYVKEPSGDVLFTTTHGLNRITKAGELQTLAVFPDWVKFQYANSMAISSDGSIFVGMRMFVLKLTPDAGAFTQEWLLPAECRNFALQGTNCVCSP